MTEPRRRVCKWGRIGPTRITILALVLDLFAGAIVHTEDAPRAPFHYGEIADASVWPISAVGAVTLTLDFSRKRFCTGTLIAPKLVLTAAHCLFDGKQLVNPVKVRFLAGLNKGVPAADSAAERLVISREFTPGPWKQETAATDWAVIVLQNALSIKPISVKSITREQFVMASKSGTILQVGYGIERRYLPSIVRNCRVSAGPNDGAFVYRCLTNPGYSGAPVLADIDGGIAVIGIGSGGKKNERFGIACSARQFEKIVSEMIQSK